MPTNVTSSPIKLTNSVSRNAFDISRRCLHTQKLGELLPCWMSETLPGDKFKINLDSFTRTLPIKTPCFSRIREYYDVFFVPYRLLWRDFPSMVTNMSYSAKQASSINVQRSVENTTPYLSSQELLTFLGDAAITSPSSPNKDANANDVCGFDRYASAFKLLHYCGYYGIPSMVQEDVDLKLSPFPLLAYQKIYNDFYRNNQWERESAESYNIDYLSSGQKVPLEDLFSGHVGYPSYLFKDSNNQTMLDLRYVDILKDVFFGVLPKQQYGAFSTVSTVPNAKIDSDGGLTDVQLKWSGGGLSTNNSAIFTQQTNLLRPSSGTSSLSLLQNGKRIDLSQTFDILSLRAAQSKQKYLEISLSNKTDYASQVKAHFGVKVSSLLSSMCDYLGGCGMNVDFNVTENSNLSGDNKADLKANGVSSGKKSFDFEAKEHGLLVVMHHFNVYPEYSAVGMDWPCNKVEYTDFAIPEFDKLGYEAVRTYNLNMMIDAESGTPRPYIGYNVRYYDYKTSYDVILGDFSANLGRGSAEGWRVSNGTRTNYTIQLSPRNCKLVANYDDLDNGTSLSYKDFKCSPSFLDSIMYDSASSSWSTDPFMCCTDINCTVVRNLDRKGMPY